MDQRPLIERNVKALEPAWGKTVHHVPYDVVFGFIDSDWKGFSRSSHELKFETGFDARDMTWNHMDFTHRPWIHGHYEKGVRIAMGTDVLCMGFTPFGILPFIVPTFDYRVSQNEFRQVYNLGGMFLVLMSMSIVPRDDKTDWLVRWTIVSKWYLRIFHFILHRMIARMNVRLFGEDEPVKARRRALRERGYTYLNDDMDYLTSTLLHPQNVHGPPAAELTVDVASLAEGRRTVLRSCEREFLVLRENGTLLVWDNVCLHQGAPLESAKRCGGTLECPWHGLRVAACELSASKPRVDMGGFSAALAGDRLTIVPR
jgi:hypothetical protein